MEIDKGYRGNPHYLRYEYQKINGVKHGIQKTFFVDTGEINECYNCVNGKVVGMYFINRRRYFTNKKFDVHIRKIKGLHGVRIVINTNNTNNLFNL